VFFLRVIFVCVVDVRHIHHLRVRHQEHVVLRALDVLDARVRHRARRLRRAVHDYFGLLALM
jgi:hypothetical protein